MKRVKCGILCGTVALLLGLAGAAGAQQAEHRWDLQLAGYFEGQNPLSVYARERDNRWVSGVGSSIVPGTKKYSYNKSYHFVDLSRVPIVNGRMKGPATIHMTPDLWVPSSHQSLTVQLEVDAAVADGKLNGSYTVTSVSPNDPVASRITKSGALTGTARDYAPAPLPDETTFNLNLQGALVGGRPEYGSRCMVARLGFRGKELVTAATGSLSEKGETSGIAAFRAAANAVTYDGDGVKGKLVIPSKTLDMEPCTYTVEFAGRIMENFVIGSYTSTCAVDGGKTTTVSGSFDGRWNQGVQIVPFTDDRPWWTPVKGFTPVQPGEHPRLLFRKSDVAALRARANTPEGQAIIKRLKAQLGGGEAMPTVKNNSTAAYQVNGSKLPLGTYTVGHAAGFGLLYQLTGEQKYAELAKECFQWALDGVRDADDRYSFRKPGGALRAGVVVGWYALAYDLAYDGWDAATRQRFAKALAEYNEGQEAGDAKANLDLETLIRGTQPPGSNHFGMQVGGAAMALLAVMGDPGVDNARVQKLLGIGENSMVRNLSEGFGDGGMFAEGDGTGSMSSQIVFIPALQAWRNAKGMDFTNGERPNARMMSLKWIYLTVMKDGRPDFWPIRGAYGSNVWDRRGMSGAGYFAEGFSNVTAEQKAGMLWFYNHFLAEKDAAAGMPFDTASDNPQYSVCAFVNWPFGMQEKNPAQVLPLNYRDEHFDFYAWRNRWQDANDIVITVLMKTTPSGNYSAKADGGLAINAFGEKIKKWGGITGDTKYWWSSPKGEASVLTSADGISVAVDLTRASGCDGLLVTTDARETNGQQVKLGNTTLVLKYLTAGQAPSARVEGNQVVIGKQIVSVKDGNIVLGVTTAQ